MINYSILVIVIISFIAKCELDSTSFETATTTDGKRNSGNYNA